MQNQLCRVCDEPAAGFHFGAFTCEGCKSFFGRTSNNQSVIQECKNNYRCIINKKNRTACKACRLRKCLMVGMSKSGSRYGRRSNWFKIHCLMQQAAAHRQHGGGGGHGLAFDVPTSGGGGGMGPPSLLSRSAASSSSLSPSHDMKRTEIKATTTKPAAPLWRPLEPVSPPSSDHDRPTIISESFSPSKLQTNLPQHHFIPSSTSHSTSPPHHLSSRSPIVPDLSQLFRLHGSYSMANFADLAAANQEKEDNDDIAQHLSPLALAAAANASAMSRFPALYSAAMGSNPLAFLPPTFNIPALSALPLHKQMLLSPLLASSHLWATARKAGYPFLPAASPPTTTDGGENVLAEHKALLERFRSSFSAHQMSSPPPMSSSFKSPTALSSSDLARVSDDDSSSLTGEETMPHLSDTEEEEEEVVMEDENVSKDNRPKRKDEMPLDLTCA